MDRKFRNLLISLLINGIISGFMLVAPSLYLLELKFTISNVGYITGIASFFYAFLILYTGFHSETVGRRKIGIGALLGILVSMIIFGIIPFFSFLTASILFIIGKISYSLSLIILINIIMIRILDLTHKKKIGHGFGMYILFTGTGYGTGLLLGGLILYVVSLQTVFFMMPVLLLVSIIFFVKSGDAKKKVTKRRRFKILNLRRTPKLFKIVLILNTLLLFIALLVDIFAVPIFQREILGMNNQVIFIVLGIAWIAYSISSAFSGKLFDRYGNRVFIIGLALIAITSMLLAITKNIKAFSIILIIDYIFFGLADPPRLALVGIVSRKNKGMLMSYFQFFSTLISSITIVFFGKIVQLFRFEYLFILRGAIQIIGIVLVLYISKLMKPIRVKK